MQGEAGVELGTEAHNSMGVAEAAYHCEQDEGKCQVKGCTANLHAQSTKHQRLRICSDHEKAKTVDVNGTDSRFCQQCCKFHTLEKFDGANRGCRKRLQKHNERRKQKTVVKKLGKELQKVVGSLLCATAKLEEQRPLDVGESSGAGSGVPLQNADALESLIQAHVRGLKNPELAGLTLPTRQPCPKEEPDSGSNPYTGETAGWHYSGHAKQPRQQWPRSNKGRMGSTPLHLSNPLHASSATNCPWGASASRVEEVSSISERAEGQPRSSPPSAWCASNEGSNEMEENQYGSSNQQALPPHADTYGFPTGYGSGGSEESHCYNDMRHTGAVQFDQAANMGWEGPRSQQAGRCNYNLNEVSADEVMDMAWSQGWHTQPSEFYGGGCEGFMGQTGLGNKPCQFPQGPRAFETPGYGYGNHFSSSMKIAGITPGALPDNLREEIVSWLQVDPREINGTIRPGCVHLTLDMWFSTASDCARAQHNMPKGFAKSVASNADYPWCSHRTLLRLPDCLITADNGEVLSDESTEEQLLSLESQSIVASPGGEVHMLATSNAQAPLLLCRSDGRYIELDNENWTPVTDGRVLISATLPAEAACGLVWFELCDTGVGSSLVSKSVPVIVANIELVAEELQSAKAVGNQAEVVVSPSAMHQVLDDPIGAQETRHWLNSYAMIAVASVLCGSESRQRISPSNPVAALSEGETPRQQQLLLDSDSGSTAAALFKAQICLFLRLLGRGSEELQTADVPFRRTVVLPDFIPV